MNFEDYRSHDAIGLAALVAAGEVTPSELLDAATARMAQVNGELNAVIVDLEGEARAAIAGGLPDGPLKGVPFLIKDIGATMAGVTTAAGSRLFATAAPALADSALVAAYRHAGLVLFGKTNTPEFGAAAVTEPVARGRTLNPWNPTRTPGGSSGGAAAAVSSGILPATHGSDGGGSIRIPASCCGLFGLKPSRGRVSAAPGGEGWGGLSINHALTRSVRDSALLLDIACQPQPGDPYWLDPPATPFLAEIGADPGRLRIGFTDSTLMSGVLAAPCAKAVRDAATLCAALGHTVEEVRPDADFEAMSAHANTLVTASIAGMLEAEGERRGTPVRQDEVESLTWLLYQTGRQTSGIQAANALSAMQALSRRLAMFFEDYDILILSTLGKPPVPVGSIDTNAADLTDYAQRLYGFIPNTQAFNIGGQPAMSVPLAWSDDDLPIGVQFVARGGREAVLFRLAAQLEAAQPWFERRPA